VIRPPTVWRTGLAALAWAATALLVVPGCDRAPAVEESPRAIPVDVYADTGRTITLRAQPPPAAAPEARASVWLARVSPARAALTELPALEPTPDTLTFIPSAPPALEVDGGLKPPLPRSSTALAVPAGARGSIELDVRVDEDGNVSEVQWVGGTRHPELVQAAIECARGMRFFPAQRAGRPVAVWCRQRFDFGGTPRVSVPDRP
jgi:TonB family protein